MTPRRLLSLLLPAALAAGLAVSAGAVLLEKGGADGPGILPPPAELPRRAAGASPPSSSSLARAGIPQSLRIPKLGIDAAVEPVGLAPDGSMDVPSSPATVAWYRPGSRPGEPGNAVIAGHLDSETGPAVFWRLRDLRPGDEVRVVDDAGEDRTFLVLSTERFGTARPPIARVFGRGNIARLNLVTCGGTWDSAAGRYRERLVVFTVAADSLYREAPRDAQRSHILPSGATRGR